MALHSWWQLAESGGQDGGNLNLYSIECAFCGERGKWTARFQAAKKPSSSHKALNFDVYQCDNCAGFVHVLWSANIMRTRHDFRVLPWPLNPKPQPSQNLPTSIARFWTQSHQSVTSGAWDAAATMARSALQLALREHGATKKLLVDQIDEIAAKGLLTPSGKDWAHEVRLLGNEASHPWPDSEDLNPEDVKACVEFLDFLLYCLYDLPAEVAKHRARRDPEAAQ